MKEKEFESSIEELQKQMDENEEKIDVNYEKMKLAKRNSFEAKAQGTLVCSVIGYMGWCYSILLVGLLKAAGLTIPIIETMPLECLQYIILGSSLGIGIIGNKYIYSKQKADEKFKEFSKAQSQTEILQEEIEYAIELMKAKNRGIAIEQAMSSFKTEQSIDYNIDTENLFETKEQARKQIKSLSTLLEEKYEELDILTTKKTLQELFSPIRSKEDNIGKIAIEFLALVVATNAINLQIMFLQNISTYNSTTMMTLFLTQYTVAITGLIGYQIVRHHNYKEVFNTLNNELGENALPDEETEDEEQDLVDKIIQKINEISMLEIHLQEQKRILESSGKKSRESSKDKSHITRLVETDTYCEEDIIDIDDDMFMAEEEQVEEKGPTLVLRRNSHNQ